MIKKIESLNKHENPSTNTNAFDIENYLNANWDTVEDVINNNADELEQAQNRIIELQNENTSLKNQIPNGEATGNPIHLSDSSDMECEIVVKGNAEQETRSGKNKYNATINKTVNNVSSIADIQYFTLNGTSSADGRVSFGLQTLKAGTYTVNLKCISGSYSNSANYPDHILKIWKGDSWNTFGTTINVNSTDKSQVSMTFTLEEDTEISLGAYYRVTDIYNNIKYAYQIVEGSNSDFDFEPYGASPSPEYSSEIVTVGSNINLLENKAITQTINGVTFTVNKDGSIMVNGTATTNTTFKINNDIVPKNISNLILSGCPNNGSKDTYDLKIELYKNGVWTKVLYDFGNGVNTEDLSEYTSCTISTTIRKDYNANNLIFKPKLEKGTVATPYSPYGQGSVEIKQVNKNFLDLTKKPYDENSSLLNGAKVTLKGGVLNVDATNSTGAVTIRSIWADYKRSSTILLPKGTYYTSLLLNLTGVESLTSKQVGGGVFTIEEDHYLTQWFFSVAQGNKSTKILQIEKGETATEYIEHQSQKVSLPIQKEFVKIGDVEDTFVKVDSKWYEKHCIKKLILDGTNINWYKAGVNTVDRYSTKDFLGKYGGKILCTHFKYANGTDELGTMWLSSASAQIYLNFAEYGTSTVADLNSWLAERYANGTPVVIYYELAEPELIECTEGQESVLNSFYTYKNITNISVDGIGTLKVNYKKDLETLINNLSATSVAE